MAIYKEEVASDIVLEHMTAARRYVDGRLSAIRVYANEGYVIYDTSEEVVYIEAIDPETGEYIIDPETGEPVMRPFITYLTMVTVPAAFFNVDTFTWVAVPRDSVPESDIYGTDEPEHEIM